MFCVKCGTQCSDNSKFCKKCGAPLNAPVVQNQQYTPETPVAQNQQYTPETPVAQNQQYVPVTPPVQSRPAASAPANSKKKSVKSEKKKADPIVISLIIAIVVALMAILGILAYILFIKDGGIWNNKNSDAIEIGIEDEEGSTDTNGEMPGGEETTEEPVQNPEDVVATEEATEEPAAEEAAEEESNLTWQEAYTQYIEDIRNAGYDVAGYDLIYVNDDDIPELAVTGETEASGSSIVTFYNGKTDVLVTSRLWFTYIERGNKLCNSDGNSGCYYDNVYEINNGKWEPVATGTWGILYGSDGYVLDADGNEVYTYSWEGVEVTESEYSKELNSVYNENRATTAHTLCKDEILARMEGKKYLSEGHYYEFVIQDVTWEEAEQICRNNGGYLATFTCEEEFNYVVDLMVKEGHSGKILYVGATRKKEYIGNQWSYTWVHEAAPVGWNSGNGNMWHPNEPSYSGEDSTGATVDEDCIDIYYSSSDKRAYLNDVSGDVLSQAPFYSGIVGFICEYDY